MFINLNRYKSMFLKWKRLNIFILVLLFLIGLFLRIYAINSNLFFGYEQGRDFLVIKEIVINHKLTLIGSKTDISGIFHGPLYYYISSIPFILSKGNPMAVSIFYVVLSSLMVFPIYVLGGFFGNKRVGIFSAFIFAVSFQSIVYARWLSNPPLAIPLVILYFIFLYRFIKGSKKNLFFASITLGLLCQSEFLNIVFFSAITLLTIIVYFHKFNSQNKRYLFLCGILAISISVGSYIIFDLRHNYLVTKSIFLLVKSGGGYHLDLLQAVSQTIMVFMNVFTSTVLPFVFPLSVIFIIVGIYLLIKKIIEGKKEFFMFSIWLFLPIFLLIVLRHGVLDHFFVSLLPLFILLVAFVIDSVWKKIPIIGAIVLVIVIIINLIAWYMNIPQNKNIFFQVSQPELKYSDQRAVIKEIYNEALGDPFYFQSYTIPYWMQDGWEYLFWYYGSNYYKYVPNNKKNNKMLFVIIQDDPGNISFQNSWLKNTVAMWGDKENEFRYGALRVEKLRVK